MKPASAFVVAVSALGLLVVGALLRPSSVSAQDPCPPGMNRSADTYGNCCWPGQGWNGSRCVGPPNSCPAGFDAGPNGCEERFTECPSGQVVMPDQAHCCWPGQRWTGRGCAGTPASCPKTHALAGDDCVPSPSCGGGKELTFDKLHCCWPGQAWSPTTDQCLGVPERCPGGLRPEGQSCVADGETMVEVPAGPFWMGCTNRDRRCERDEKPGREVTLSAFRIDKTEVTVGQYRACVDAGVCNEPVTGVNFAEIFNWGNDGREAHPVNGVSWDDAVSHCGWLGRRLPTEAEWEKAARGSDGRTWPWGNKPPNGSRGVWNEDWSFGTAWRTAPVGSKPSGASPYGALDMAGNVSEWTADWYARDTYTKGPSENPLGPATGSERVARGGSMYDHADEIRASSREPHTPSYNERSQGFRCAM